jgi:ABC-type branched-subunit amino acid transport system permease subunit
MNKTAASSLPSWPLPLAALAAAVTVMLFLKLEAQWEIALLALGVVVVLYAAARSGFVTRVESSADAHPRLALGSALAASLAVVAVLHDSHFALLMLATVALYATVCFGLTLQFGYAGVVNFAGAAFFGIGAYASAVFAQHTGLPHLLILLLGGLLAAVIGSVLVLPMLRTRGHYAALITIAFGILFRTFLEVNDTLGGPQGLKVPGLQLAGWSFNEPIPLAGEQEASFYVSYAVLALLLAAAAFVLVKRLERSWIGLSLDALRSDETAAATFGIDVARWKILAFMGGNFLAGLAGAVYGMMAGFVAPASFTFGDSLLLVAIVLLGGNGNPLGVIPAALLVVVLPEKLQVIQEYRLLLFAVLVILILRFRPAGLLPRGMREYFPGWTRT